MVEGVELPKAAIRSRQRGVIVVVEGEVRVGGVVDIVAVAVVAVHMVVDVGVSLESSMAVAWEGLECTRGSEGGVVVGVVVVSNVGEGGVESVECNPQCGVGEGECWSR